MEQLDRLILGAPAKQVKITGVRKIAIIKKWIVKQHTT